MIAGNSRPSFIGIKLRALLLLTLLSIANALVADDALDIKLSVHKIDIAEDGTEVFVEADTAKPGDLVLYRAVYKNTSASVLKNLKPSVPVPDGLFYLMGSARPDPVEFHLESGSVVSFPIEAKDSLKAKVKSVHWQIDSLAPGEQALVSVRARVPSE